MSFCFDLSTSASSTWLSVPESTTSWKAPTKVKLTSTVLLACLFNFYSSFSLKNSSFSLSVSWIGDRGPSKHFLNALILFTDSFLFRSTSYLLCLVICYNVSFPSFDLLRSLSLGSWLKLRSACMIKIKIIFLII